MSKKRVLLTGAAGCIGRACRQHWGDHFSVRCLVYTDDQVPDDSDDVVVGGCQNFDLMVQATAGMDAVVHLAAIGGASLEPLLDSNMIGTYNVIEAARRNGVGRVVFASTNHVTGGWESDGILATPDMPPRADSLYGVTKAFGEVLGRFYADRHGLEFVAVRIGGVYADDRPHVIRDIWMWTSQRDMAELLRRAVQAEGIRFAIVYGGSNNPNSCLELASADDILGFVPQDDVIEYLDDLPAAIVARHEATVWQALDKGTGHTLK